MDNLINSLVNNFVSNAGNANMNKVTDYQGKSYDRDQLLALSRQVAGSIDANAIKGGVFNTKGESVGFNYDQATNLLGHPPTAAEQVILDMSRHLLNEGVTDLNQANASNENRRFGSTYTGGGGTIYEIKKDADGKPVISSWSKDTSDKKTILTGLALAAAAFGIPGVTEGLLNGSAAGTTMGTVGAEAAGSTAFELANAGAGAFEGGTALNALANTGAGSAFELANAGAGAFEGGTALNSLASMTPAELAKFEAMNAGSTAMSDLGASELANAGASANTVGGTTAANAANLANTAAGATAGLSAADALKLGLTTAGLANVAGTVVNQDAISKARDLISQGSTTAADVLSNAYKDQQGYYTGNRTDLGNIYANTNTNLNNIIGRQVGVYNDTNTSLGKTYADTQADLARVYNQQVGFHKPYQAVGKAGSEGLIANKDYFNKQFGTADLNTELAPNYAFQLGQGQMANQRAANMGGGSIGGNALQGLQKYTQDYAGNAYQQAFNNFQNQRQNIYNNFSGMANIGLTSAGQLASLGNTYGSNLGALSSNYGSNRVANAGQLQGAYNQYGSNLTNAANQYGSNLTNSTGQMLNAGSLYGANRANLAVGTAGALANNAVAGGANVAGGLNNLSNLALLGSVIKPK